MLVPPTAALAGVGYMSYLAFCPEGRPKPSNRCNNIVRLDEKKVVDTVDIEDIAEKAAFCRCWKSKNVGFFVANGWFLLFNISIILLFLFQWPYCDGAHGAHNKETGDNVGPIVVKRKA